MARTRKRQRIEAESKAPVLEVRIERPLEPGPTGETADLAWLRILPLLGLGLCGLVNLFAYKVNVVVWWLAKCGLAESEDIPYGRIFPMMAGDTLLLALPLLALPWLWLRGEPRVRSWVWWWLAGACAFLAWQALVNVVQPTVPPIAWAHFGNRCLIVCAAAAVLLAPTGVAGSIRLLAFGSVVAIALYVLPRVEDLLAGHIRVFTELEVGNAIYGNVSWIVNAAAPGLLAFIALRSAERQREAPPPVGAVIGLALVAIAAVSGIVAQRFGGISVPPWGFVAVGAVWAVAMGWWWGLGRGAGTGVRCWEGWLVLAGTLLLLTVSIPTARRGFVLYLVLIAGWFVWERFRQRNARAAWWALGISIVVVIACALTVLMGTDLLRHTDRAMQARAAIEAAGKVFPWGWGGYAALQFHDSAPDCGDYIITWMKIHEHVHNEGLEILLHAGWFGLAGALALLVWLGTRVCGITDPVQRTGVAVACLGVLVPTSTDNTIFTTMGACTIGAIFGIALRGAGSKDATESSPQDTPLANPPARWWRLALVPVIVMAAWIGLQTARVASLPSVITDEKVIYMGIENAKDVYVAKILSNYGLLAAGRAHRLDIGLQVIRKMDERLGPKPGSGLPPVPWGLEPFNYVLESTSDPELRADACIRCLSSYPFEDLFYQELDKLRNQHPSIAERIPPVVRRRLDWWYRPQVAEPVDLTHAPKTVSAAADQYIRLRSLIFKHDADAAQVPVAIENLLKRYRLIPNLTKLALEAIIALPPADAERVAERERTAEHSKRERERWGLLSPEGNNMAQFISEMVKETAQAKRIYPLFARLYPDEMKTARRAAAGEDVGEVSPLVAMLVKVIGLCGGVSTLPPDQK